MAIIEGNFERRKTIDPVATIAALLKKKRLEKLADERRVRVNGLSQRDIDNRNADWHQQSETVNARMARLLGPKP